MGFQPFNLALTSTSFDDGNVIRVSPFFAGDPDRCNSPVAFTLIAEVTTDPSGLVHQGAHLRVRSIGGAAQPREIYLADQPRRWSGVCLAVQLAARLEIATDSLRLQGAVFWGEDASRVDEVSNLAVRRTLSEAQATTDGALTGIGTLATVQSDVRRLAIHVDALSGGSAMVPVRVELYGRRFAGQAFVRIGAFVVDATVGGSSNLIFTMPGEFDQVGYRVFGFPGGGIGGSATMQVFEQLGSES